MTKLELTMKLAEATTRIAELTKALTTQRTQLTMADELCEQLRAEREERPSQLSVEDFVPHTPAPRTPTRKPEVVRAFVTHELAAERAKLHSCDPVMRSKYVITCIRNEVHYVAR